MIKADSFDMQRFLAAYRKVLKWTTIGLAGFFMLWTLMQYVIWDKPYLKLQKWIATALIAGTLVYLIIAKTKCPEEVRRIEAFRKRMISPEQIFVLIFVAWYIVVCGFRSVYEHTSYFTSNDNRLFYMSMAAFSLFPLVEIAGRDKARRVIEIMMNSGLFMYTAVCAWVLWNYYHGILVALPSGYEVTLYRGSALQIGGHRNITASYSIILVGICIYMLFTARSKLRFLAYIPCALINITVIMLTNSRTSFIVLVAMISGSFLIRALKHIKFKNKGVAIIALVVIVVIGAVLMFYLRNGILSFHSDVWKEKLQNNNAMKARNMTNLNGRVNIWKASIKLMLSSPDRFFFGVTPTDLQRVLMDIGKFPVKQPHCHNLILHVGCCFGVPMMIAYTWFIVSIVRRAFHVMVYTGDKLFKNSWTVPMIVSGILLTETVEVLTMANRCFNLPVFFILAGCIVAMDKTITGTKSKECRQQTIR